MWRGQKWKLRCGSVKLSVFSKSAAVRCNQFNLRHLHLRVNNRHQNQIFQWTPLWWVGRIWWRFLRFGCKVGAVCSPALTTEQEQEESAFPAVGVKIQKRRLMNFNSSALPFFSQMTQCGREFTTSAEPILSVGLSFEDNAYPFILIFLWLYKRDFTLKLLFINDIHWIVEKILWL